MTPRNNFTIDSQEFVLLVTIRNSKASEESQGLDIYSDAVKGFSDLGYVLNDLEMRQQIRQRQ